MNRVRKLIKNSIVLYNRTILQNYNVIESRVCFSADALAYRTSGTIKMNSSKLTDEIKDTIKNIKRNQDISFGEALQILYKLHNVFKVKRNIYYEDVKNLEEITCLLEIIYENLKHLNMYNTIRVLQVLVSWKVPYNTTLVLTLLQLIRASVNDLSVGQILTVHNILRKIPNCRVATSLNTAMCHVFQQQVYIELNSSSNNLIEALKFAFLMKNRKTISYIMSILAEDPKNIDIRNVVDIFHVLYNTPETKEMKVLLFHLRNIIKTNVHNLTLNQIMSMLRYISKSCAYETMKFYDEKLIFILYSSALKDNITFHEIITILTYLNTMHFNSIFLLNYIVKHFEDKDFVRKFSLQDIAQFTKALVIADYTPNNWKIIQDILEDYIINADCSIQNAISIGFYLFSLDCKCPKLLEKIFTLYNKLSIIDQITPNILKLHWCVKLLYPTYDKILLNENKLRESKIRHEESDTSCLMESLKQACGSDKYMKSDLKTKWGFFVDNIVVKQPDGSLMDISSYDNITFIEELASLSKYNIILFIALRKSAYAINTRNMLSTVKVQLKAIKKLPGYHISIIDPFSWQDLTPEEKVVHLQQVIKEEYDNISNI